MPEVISGSSSPSTSRNRSNVSFPVDESRSNAGQVKSERNETRFVLSEQMSIDVHVGNLSNDSYSLLHAQGARNAPATFGWSSSPILYLAVFA